MKVNIPAVAVLLLCGCSREIPMVNVGLQESYAVSRLQKLPLTPALTGEEYRWTVDGVEVSREREFVFMSPEEGHYSVSFEIIDPLTPFRHEMEINVVHEEVEYSPYISRVYEYRPAPGQFVNEMPQYVEGDSYADILRKAEESITGTNDIMITLGGFGGYVTFGFDHTVANMEGEDDFRLWGNCFYELLDKERKGGSAEPGIIMVSYDRNCNGLPDDEWYELEGSAHLLPDTKHNYTITYFRPAMEKGDSPADVGTISDPEYIRWEDSDGKTGYIEKNIFHSQDYYPRWITDDRLQFGGTCLPSNGVDISGDGSYYILYCYDWGYADNHPNEYAGLNSFDIGNARDKEGNPVKLPGADFIRVYTGVNQSCGWLGETSTEICRAADLHIRPPTPPP